ncbi:Leucine-rich repeat serine/threonine-protein kinase 1, partial [Hondaea fermentalgiana]
MREIVGKEHFRETLTLEEYQKLSTQAEAIDFLRFWLHSIRLHAPEAPVLMIGTFLDQVTQLREVDRVLREHVGATSHEHLVQPSKGGHLFFAIDNSSNDKNRAVELRTAIASVASEQRYVREQVPLAWLKLHEDMLQSGEPFMLYDEVVERAAEYGRDRADVDAMLEYFHGLGVVVHLRGSETLESVVVIDAEWLLKKLARVIADDLHAQSLFYDRDLKSAGLLPAYERLRKDMIATRSLLEWLWADQEVDYLLQFMEANMLLCPWRFDEHRDEDEYLVSGLLSDSSKHIDTRDFEPGLTCELDFSEFFLPNGVFHRLVAQCAAYASQPEISGDDEPMLPALDSKQAMLSFGVNDFMFTVDGDVVRICIDAAAERPAMVIKLL